MPDFPLLIKPSSADCNLNCGYCFYLGHSDFYPGGTHRMTPDVLEGIVRSYLATRQKQHVFIWQGGEPLLMGADFFRRVVELQVRHGSASGATISNGVQTNGTLVTDELAELFATYKFLLGVSVDGPPDVHDKFRLNAAGAGTHSAVMRGVEILRRRGVSINALALVTRASEGRGAKIFNWLVDNGFDFLQFIPCAQGNPHSVPAGGWGDFLCAVFDEWRRIGEGRVSVRLFDSILEIILGGDRTLCHFKTNCRRYFLVEYNGDVYPCDFYVEKDLKIGNALTDTWEKMWNSPVFRKFGKTKGNLEEACEACRWFELCAGDCPKHRPAQSGTSELCAGWKQFYEHSMPHFQEIARNIRNT